MVWMRIRNGLVFVDYRFFVRGVILVMRKVGVWVEDFYNSDEE